MGVWIAAVVILMLIGSVSWAMPSPRDRLLAAMRTKAMRKGIKVRLVDKTLAGALFPWLEYFQGYVLYEKELPVVSKNKSRDIKVFKLHAGESMTSAKGSCTELIDLLRLISDCEDFTYLISAIVVSSSSLAVLWKEQGTVDDVERLDSCLEKLNQEDRFWELVLTL